MAEVVLEQVNKHFGDVHAVKNFNLTIKDEEFLVLVGPSGCGKSTTLRLTAGLETLSSGSIYIGGRLVNDVDPKDRDIAMVFQNYALYPHMNVYNNMAFGLRLRDYSREEIDERVHDTASLLGIEELLERLPKALSGGQRQRVALGRAIVREPQVFLMDEPLSNLDAKLRVQMRTELALLHQRLRTTTIYVTHDQTEAMTLGDRIVVMNEGEVQQVAPPQELYDHPANVFVAGFIGSPAMNFVEGRLEAEDDALWFASGSFRVRLADSHRQRLLPHTGRRVVFGIRPEDITLEQAYIDAHPEAAVTASVDVVEPMGAEAVLYLSSGDASLTARVEPHVTVQEKDEVTVGLSMEAARIFDAETTESLMLEARAAV